MSEGELHKKIREKAREDYHCDLGTVVDCLLVKADFFEVLAEAKQDFPNVPLNHPEELTSEDYYKELSNDREAWFERWFGKTK